MKYIVKYLLVILISISTSCSNFLEPDLGYQLTLEETFSKQNTTERYLAHVYSFLPNDFYLVGDWGFSRVTSTVARSDESQFSWDSGIEYLAYNNGSWNPTTSSFHTWTWYYQGINQAEIFMSNVDRCNEISEENKANMKKEARFLKAYYYSLLIQQYGPVFIKELNNSKEELKSVNIDRHPLDDCINFVLNEYDDILKDYNVTEVPLADWAGRITRGAIMAAKSRFTLYAARPLFNGCEWYIGMKNHYGQYLFPQTRDPKKWDNAAKAAKEVIDLNQYKLYEVNDQGDQMSNAIKSYQGIYFVKWNSEIIWARWESNGKAWNVRAAPSEVLREGYSGYAPSLKLVDTYPMKETGRFPISGYTKDGEPLIDGKSKYVENGFTENYQHPADKKAPSIKAHNSCVGRDARFYSSILFSGMYWINDYYKYKLVTFHKGGSSSFKKGADYVKVGYLFRRMSDPINDVESGKWGEFSWPYFRLGEIYLNYAEACNEKQQRDEEEGLKYWNKVRERSGLNKIQEAYPEIIGNKELFRELLLKERMVELAFENHRYYDIRQWMIADKESNGKRFGRNLSSESYEDSWKRTDAICLPIVCLPKHYLFPIHQNQLNEMKNITQNYGW